MTGRAQGRAGLTGRSAGPVACPPAARVVCLDAADRVLLPKWRDPYDGSRLREPPGGGIEPGETPLEAARRELAEETGLDPAAILDRPVPVDRDVRWKGRRYSGTELFFPTRFGGGRPAVSRAVPLPHERNALEAYAWVPWPDLGSLPGRVEPPRLLPVLAALLPGGPWRERFTP
ncbi:NUDIX domain-containing protein [Streptomyces atacamensis]|uniref:NUDIX domain-containing protein n=1 Tax=Streptomyces atacamensis TaxID=531966 RepID=UPI00399C92CD